MFWRIRKGILTVALTKLMQETQMHLTTPAKPWPWYGESSIPASQYHTMSPPNRSMPIVTYLSRMCHSEWCQMLATIPQIVHGVPWLFHLPRLGRKGLEDVAVEEPPVESGAAFLILVCGLEAARH